MLFNSFDFALFLVVVLSLYWLSRHKLQNRLLLVASYFFYAYWDWRFLSLILLSTLIDYFCGLRIHDEQNQQKRKIFLAVSVCANLGILGFFKYFHFFADSLRDLTGLFGLELGSVTFNIVLPIGISFYTFQTMSYTIDIYRGQLKPTKNFLDFALFVSFFPQLVAGPIERARNLLPQIQQLRSFHLNRFYEGCFLIFWGLFQKVFVADNLGVIVDNVFGGEAPYVGIHVLIALYAFAFQIFCDFAGYSNIARGVAKTLGFDLMVNFRTPYFATNPRDFWGRWHISLSTWLRDYVYLPLGGNRGGRLQTCRNLMLTMLLGGLWHGASWVFVLWGAFHGTILMIHRAIAPWLERLGTPKQPIARHLWFYLRIIFFFHVVCVGWLIFRATSLEQLFEMLRALIFNFNLSIDSGWMEPLRQLFLYTFVLLVMNIFQYRSRDLLCVLKAPAVLRSAVYVVVFYAVVIFGLNYAQSFIYFQF